MKTIGQLIKQNLVELAEQDKLPADFNELEAYVFDSIALGASKQFPNGFTSWLETHHEVVAYITRFMDSYQYTEVFDKSEVIKVIEGYGTGGIYELAESWTDEFETLHEHDEWDEADYFDSLEEFCNLKNYGNGSKL